MGALQIITPLIARHNVYNILAAVAVGLAVTVDGEPIPLKVLILGCFLCAVQGRNFLSCKMTTDVSGRGMHCFPKSVMQFINNAAGGPGIGYG